MLLLFSTSFYLQCMTTFWFYNYCYCCFCYCYYYYYYHYFVIIIIPVFSFLLLRTRKRPYKNRKSNKTASKQLVTAVQHGDQLEDNEDDQPVINTSITISTTINIWEYVKLGLNENQSFSKFLWSSIGAQVHLLSDY